MVLTVLTIVAAMSYLLFRSPDPAWYLTGGLILLLLCALPALYLVRDAKLSRPVTNNRAAVWILVFAIGCSEMLLSIPYDLLRVLMSPWPVALSPILLALWVGYRNDPLRNIF